VLSLSERRGIKKGCAASNLAKKMSGKGKRKPAQDTGGRKTSSRELAANVVFLLRNIHAKEKKKGGKRRGKDGPPSPTGTLRGKGSVGVDLGETTIFHPLSGLTGGRTRERLEKGGEKPDSLGEEKLTVYHDERVQKNEWSKRNKTPQTSRKKREKGKGSPNRKRKSDKKGQGLLDTMRRRRGDRGGGRRED